MDFRSIYQHGFARVAACTGRVAIADPPTNAETVLRAGARRAREEGVAVARLPRADADRLLASRTSLLQDAAARRRRARARHRRRGHRRPAAGDRRRRAAAPPQPGLQLRGRHPPRRGSSASSRSPTCRPTASSTSAGRSPPATTSAARSASAARTCRSGPTCCSPPRTCPGLVVHVEVCEDMWVPMPAERRGGAGRRDRPAQPLRQPDHGRPRRGPQAAVPLGVARAAWPPTSTPPPGQGESTHRPVVGRPDDGLRERRAARPRPSASPTATARAVADVDLDLLRQERLRMGTFDDNRRTHAARPALPHASASRSTRPTATSACGARVERFPFVPADVDAPRPGLLRGLQHPGRRARSSGCARSATRRSSSASPAGSTRRTR